MFGNSPYSKSAFAGNLITNYAVAVSEAGSANATSSQNSSDLVTLSEAGSALDTQS